MFEKIKKNISFAVKLHKKSYVKSLKDFPTSTPLIWSKIYYKEYPRFPSILLPTRGKLPKVDFIETLLNRASSRKYKSRPLTIDKLSQLLYLSAGINRIDKKNNIHKRTYPSGGARYPLELYLFVLRDTAELVRGIYHYNVKFHSLELIKEGSHLKKLKEITGKINTEVMENCSILLTITAVFNRNEIKYGKRSYRYTLLECGHLAQNICLTSTALNLECCTIGGFADKELNQLLSYDEKKEQALYLGAIGNKKTK